MYKPVSLQDLKAHVDQPWVVEGLIRAGQVGEITGTSRTGRYFLAADLAASIARGEMYAVFDVPRPAPVAWLAPSLYGLSGLFGNVDGELPISFFSCDITPPDVPSFVAGAGREWGLIVLTQERPAINLDIDVTTGRALARLAGAAVAVVRPSRMVNSLPVDFTLSTRPLTDDIRQAVFRNDLGQVATNFRLDGAEASWL